ncbi:MAG: hypothetical protein L0241_22585 [Planctomycetia bacterium]|nr:hypothetical protein [Planctomycetia bacterium]
MTLRRLLLAFVAVAVAPAVASAATYDTANFSTQAPTAELAKKFGDMAEFYRKEKALEWLGREMPQWSRRCPLQIQITHGSAGGATTFTFGSENGKPVVTSQQMEIRGEAKQLLNSVLPHEVTHTVLAHHFGRPVPRWADEGGSVLSENDEERFNHDVRCRELLNAGRGIVLRTLFRLTDYPRDMIVLYAQGYSVTSFLVKKGGDGRAGRGKLLQFLAHGMQGNTADSWNTAANKVYGFASVDAMEEAWLTSLKTPPTRVVAHGTTPPGGLTSSGGTKSELRSSAAPAVPLLEPPVKAVRAAPPETEPMRPVVGYPSTPVSPSVPCPTGTCPKPMAPDRPPPILLPPEIPRPVKP